MEKVQWGSALAAGRLDLAIKQPGRGSTECVIPQSNWNSGSDKRKNRGHSRAYGGHGVPQGISGLGKRRAPFVPCLKQFSEEMSKIIYDCNISESQ